MNHDFIRGAVAMSFLIAAGFFFRFWRDSRDRLFAFFAVAFLLMSFVRPLTLVLGESRAGLCPYLIRLFAYLIILVAIIDKNLRAPRLK